ncbi:50S ribosomal protein L21 [Patescibacteria group bacterium]|nr:50S ribosomal protein L21 [Patescibacteria group bacterium]
MFYAVINSGGKQYRISEGDTITVDKLGLKKDEKVKFDQILMVVSDGDVRIGKPTLADVEVVGKSLGDIKGEKIRVAKFKAKSKYRRAIGFRAQLSQIQIESITVKGKSKVEKEEKPKKTTTAKVK